MSRLNLSKKIMAIAFAVAGLTAFGADVSAQEIAAQELGSKRRATIITANDMSQSTKSFLRSMKLRGTQRPVIMNNSLAKHYAMPTLQGTPTGVVPGVNGTSVNIDKVARSAEGELILAQSDISLVTNSAQSHKQRGTLTGAAAPAPTLDDMNEKASSFTPTSHYTLVTTRGNNTDFLLLDNGSGTLTQYWYTPAEGTVEKNNILNYLTGVALVPTDSSTDYVFVTPNGAHYTFDMLKPRPASIYTGSSADTFAFKNDPSAIATFSAGASDDYNVKVSFDKNHAKYYNINIVPSKVSHIGNKVEWVSSSIQPLSPSDWIDNIAGSNVTIDDTTVAGAIRLKTPHNGTVDPANTWNKYFTYTYNKPSTYSFIKNNPYAVTTSSDGTANNYNVVIAGRSEYVVTNTVDNVYGDISNKTYANNVLTANFSHKYNIIGGGAVLNQGIIGDVIADFVANRVTSSLEVSGTKLLIGGAIANVSVVFQGGASINSITGDFIGNSSSTTNSDSHGGAISNYSSGTAGEVNIGSITGDFIGNSSSSSQYGVTYGGAISNYAKSGTASIGSIGGGFHR